MTNDDYQANLKQMKQGILMTNECTENLEALFAGEGMTDAMEKINEHVAKTTSFLSDVDQFTKEQKQELTPLITEFFQAMEKLTQKAVKLNEMDQLELMKIRKHERSAMAYVKASGNCH